MSMKAIIFAVAAVVFTGQQVYSAADTAEATVKASSSCQNWSEHGYGELMGCK